MDETVTTAAAAVAVCHTMSDGPHWNEKKKMKKTEKDEKDDKQQQMSERCVS